MTHVTRITKSGAAHPIEPQSVVLLDPATGNPYAAGGSGSGGTSDTTEATQLLVHAAVQAIDADLGATSDAAAPSDTGTFSLIALVKRGLSNWSALLTRIPSLVSGRIPVAVDAAAATAALQTAGNASLTSLDAKHPLLVSGRVPVTSQDTNGEGAVTYITNTSAVTGLNARQVVCLTDTTFATFTRTNATGSITGVALPAGTLLTGPVTAITLTSGAVAAYA